MPSRLRTFCEFTRNWTSQIVFLHILEHLLNFFLDPNSSSASHTPNSNSNITPLSSNVLMINNGMAQQQQSTDSVSKPQHNAAMLSSQQLQQQQMRSHPFAQSFPPSDGMQYNVHDSNSRKNRFRPMPAAPMFKTNHGSSFQQTETRNACLDNNITDNSYKNSSNNPTTISNNSVYSSNSSSANDITVATANMTSPQTSTVQFCEPEQQQQNMIGNSHLPQVPSLSSSSISNMHNHATTAAAMANSSSHQSLQSPIQQQHMEWLRQMNHMVTLKASYDSAKEQHRLHQQQQRSSVAPTSATEAANMLLRGNFPIVENRQQQQVMENTNLTAQLMAHAAPSITQSNVNRGSSTLAARVQAQAEENLKRLSIAMNLQPHSNAIQNLSSSHSHHNNASTNMNPTMNAMKHTFPRYIGTAPVFSYTTSTAVTSPSSNNRNASASASLPSIASTSGSATGVSGSLTNPDERRARRLARNRESARQSRRRKKEQLVMMGEKVLKSWDALEMERTARLSSMERGFRSAKLLACGRSLNENYYASHTTASATSSQSTTSDIRDVYEHCIRPDCAPRMAVVNHQYRALKRLVFPQYKRFLLWMSFQPTEIFFSKGKSTHVLSKPTGKGSSKQVGEEIYSRYIQYQSQLLPSKHQHPPINTTTSNHHNNQQHIGNQQYHEIWPLFCFQHSISLDQEDRFLEVYDAALSTDTISSSPDGRKATVSKNDRRSIKSAVDLVDNLKKVYEAESRNVERKTRKCYLDILTPEQVVKYMVWAEGNRERCRKTLSFFHTSKENSTHESSLKNLRNGRLPVDDLCNRLNEVLKIHCNQSDRS